MNYQTYFSLKVENDKRFKCEIIETLYNEIYLDSPYKSFSDDECKDTDYDKVLFYDSLDWDDWYDTMIWLSKEFPECTFHLEGHGDDHDDWWEAHFKNGYGYQQMAIIPPFDPAKLRMEDTCLGIDEVI